MRIVFSRDRAAQLDLLLRSIERNMLPEQTTVLWTATNEQFRLGYDEIVAPHVRFVYQETEVEFDQALKETIAESETITFFCDDDIVFQPVPAPPASLLQDGVLCVRLVIGQETKKQKLPQGFPVWQWEPLPRNNFGFVGGVDGDTYRSKETLEMLGGELIGNPTWIETVLAMRYSQCAEHLPYATCFPHQCVVGNAVNRVSPSSGVGCGFVHPQTTVQLNNRFLAGERIDFDSLDFEGITSSHHEILFRWT